MVKAIFMDFGDTIVVEEEGKKLADMELIPVPGVEKFFEEYASRLPIVIISNTIHSRKEDIERLLEEMNFRKFIHRVVTSLDLGVAKPDPLIFRKTLEAMALKPEEVLMIGDRMDTDIEGAHRAGIRSIYLNWNKRHEMKKAPSQIQPTFRSRDFSEVRKIISGLMLASKKGD